MDNRRFVTFLVFFFAFTYVYTELIIPKFFPRPAQPVAGQNAESPVDDSTTESNGTDSSGDKSDEAADSPDLPTETADTVDDAPAVHPAKSLTLGSLDPDSGYFLQVALNSAGAAIESVQLSDPKFRELTDREQQVTVIGTNTTEDRSLSTAVSKIDAQLESHELRLASINWKVESADSDHATFSFESPDRTLKVEKTYRIQRVDVPVEQRKEAYRTNAGGFTIELELKITNLSENAQSVDYELQGPVGVILENAEHTRKYLDVKLEFLDDDDAVTMGAKAVDGIYEERFAEARAAGQTPTPPELRNIVRQKDPWTGAFRYAAVDVQFFAAVISSLDERPDAERLANNRIDRIYPVMIQKDRLDVNKSDISFRMASTPVDVAAGSSFSHRFAFFVGPKRSQLLDPPPLEAEQVLDYGSWFGTIARGMHWLLDTFHGWGMPYVLAIISLTVLVRGCMFPLSRKQAISAAKMKELQPKINELKTKYGDDKQKIAQAQMELWRKHNINPLGGCFPLLFQFPVFIALYTCLNTAVDLRLSSFLWIDNLAAPDAIARMPRLPFLGSDFNLLPCITVVLFLIQQKMFMPPPADEQQAAQQKMMNFMTIFFGVMFWHVPAGLCIYFIASSLWGIAERQLLGNTSVALADEPSVVVKDDPKSKSGAAKNQKEEPAQKGFFARLMEAAEEAQKQAEKTREKQNKSNKKKGR